MSIVVNNHDRITFKLTSYGLNRVTQALLDSNVTLDLHKIKVGDANGEYYEASELQTELVHPIENGSFFVLDKALLEDGETVSFHTVFPEDFSGIEIREVGLYETTEDEEDHLFAIATMQPIVKPELEIGYIIDVDFYIFLKSVNLASVYEQIIIDSESRPVTQEDLDDLMNTILFTESNLMEQINSNSRVIGLNRPQQLYERMEVDTENYGYITSYNNYTTLLDYKDTEEIFSYWLFNYPRRVSPQASIVDINKYGRNLSCDSNINSYSRSYLGYTPMLNFSDESEFYIRQSDRTFSYNPNVFVFVGSLNINSLGNVSNFWPNVRYLYTRENIDLTQPFEITGNFTPNGVNGCLVSCGDFKLVLNENLTTDITFTLHYKDSSTSCEARYSISSKTTYYYRIVFSGENYAVYIDTIESGIYDDSKKLKFNIAGELVTEVPTTISGATNSVVYFGSDIDGNNTIDGSMDLPKVSISLNGLPVFSGGRYVIANNVNFLNDNENADIPFSMIFELEPNDVNSTRTLLARSDYATNTHIFEIQETPNRELKVTLFSDSNNYITFTSAKDVIPSEGHVIILSYEPQEQELNVYIDSKRTFMTKTSTGTYIRMNSAPAILYGFVLIPTNRIYTDSSSVPTALYNADGSPYTGFDWVIIDNIVYFNREPISYSGQSASTDALFKWQYSDGLDLHVVYTKDRYISETTKLYNENYTLYNETDFAKVQVGSDYIITYKGQETTFGGDVPAKTIYLFQFTEAEKDIWANNITSATLLYDSNGDEYTGSDWHIENGKVYYKSGEMAVYTESKNRDMPSLPLTSYITSSSGSHIQKINSKVGIISIIKSSLSLEEMRVLSLALRASMGKNPCTSTY